MATQEEKDTAIAEYPGAAPETKKLLEKIFGKETFISSMDYLKCWGKFCKEHKCEDLVLPYPEAKNADEEYLNAQFMMMHIIRRKRKKKPDFNNSNETKYNAVFDMRTASGFALSDSAYDAWCAHSAVGSRLCIPEDRQLMEQLAVEFLPIYEKIMIEP